MMKNVTKTNNKTVLLAILAVFAMIAAGAAVVMSAADEADAASIEAIQLTDAAQTTAAGKNYVVTTEDATVTIAAAPGDDYAIYMKQGSALAITGTGATVITINVYLCTNITGSGTSWTVTSATASELVIKDGAATAATLTVSPDAKYVTYENAGPTVDSFGVNIADKYYPIASNVTYDFGMEAVETVVIKDGSATISQEGDRALANGSLSIAAAADEPAGTVTITSGWVDEDDNDNPMSIAIAGGSNHTITMVSGAATSGASLAGTTVNAYSNAVITGVANLTAAPVDNVTKFVYGAPSAKTIKVNADGDITFVTATGTFPIQYGDANWTVEASSTSVIVGMTALLATIDDGEWTAGNLNLVSGMFALAEDAFAADLVIGTNAVVTLTKFGATAGEAPTIVTKNLTVRGALYVPENTGGDHFYAKAMTVTDYSVGIYGSFVAAQDIDVTVKATNKADNATFKANSGSTLTNINVAKDPASKGTVTIDLSGATGTVYLAGTISASATYSQTQAVVVNGDLEITGNAVITIKGSFDVLEGVTMTIAKGAVVIQSSTADMDIDGIVYIEELGAMNIVATKAVTITGAIDNSGEFSSASEKAVLKSGATFINEDDAIFSAAAFTVDTGAVMTLYGTTQLAEEKNLFVNKGTVVLDGTEFLSIEGLGNPAAPYITQAASGAEVKIVSFTFVEDEDANVLTISDLGIQPTATQNYKNGTTNVLELTALYTGHYESMGVAGISIVSTSSTSTYMEVTTLNRTMTINGVATVADAHDVAKETGAAKITLAQNAAVETVVPKSDLKLGETFNVSKGVTLNILSNMTYDGILALAGGNIVSGATGELTITGTICSAKSDTSNVSADGGAINAIWFNITSGTDTTKYWTGVEDGMAIIELSGITDNITVTVLGNGLVVSEDTEIPANVRLQGDSTITIGSAYNTSVTVVVEDGATIAAAVKINVYGSLIAMNVKKVTPASITSDVTVTAGNVAEFTGLARALSEAEAGETITVTKETGIRIESNLTIPAGVTLVVPDDIAATVTATKVTVTVNGTLQCNKLNLEGATYFDVKAEENTAVIIVNGTLMVSGHGANQAGIDAAAQYYNASNAYWYVSDAVGDYVYIGSLANAIASGKDVYVYGKVNESASVSTAKKVTLDVFDNVDVDTVLTVSDIVLKDKGSVVAALGLINGNVTGACLDGSAPATLKVSKYSGTIACAKDAQGVYATTFNAINANSSVTVAAGVVDVAGVIAQGAGSTIVVAKDAILSIEGDNKLTIGAAANIAGSIVADNKGELVLDPVDASKVVITGYIVASYDILTENAGKVTINESMAFASGNLVAADGAEIAVNDTIYIGTMPTSVGATDVTVEGAIRLANDKAIVVFYGADVDDMVINPDPEGADSSVYTLFAINGTPIMAVFVDELDFVAAEDILAEMDFSKISGLDAATLAKLGGATVDVTAWGLTPGAAIGSVDEADAVVKSAKANVKISVATGMSIYVDGVRYSTGDLQAFTVGAHTVTVTVNPGYKYADGTSATVTFNGKALSGLMVFEITADMTAQDFLVLSAVGDIVVDQPDIPEQEKEDNSMIMILLGVLVVMVVILAIVTVIRMMRS